MTESDTRHNSPYPNNISTGNVRFQGSEKKSTRCVLTLSVIGGATSIVILSLVLILSNVFDVTVEYDLQRIPEYDIEDYNVGLSDVNDMIIAKNNPSSSPSVALLPIKPKASKSTTSRDVNLEIWWSTKAREGPTTVWSKIKNINECCSTIWYFSSFFKMENDENFGKIWISKNNKKFILRKNGNWMLSLSPSGDKSVLISPQASGKNVKCPNEADNWYECLCSMNSPFGVNNECYCTTEYSVRSLYNDKPICI